MILIRGYSFNRQAPHIDEDDFYTSLQDLKDNFGKDFSDKDYWEIIDFEKGCIIELQVSAQGYVEQSSMNEVIYELISQLFNKDTECDSGFTMRNDWSAPDNVMWETLVTVFYLSDILEERLLKSGNYHRNQIKYSKQRIAPRVCHC